MLVDRLKGGFFFGKYGLNIDNLNPIQHFEGLFSVEIGDCLNNFEYRAVGINIILSIVFTLM